MLESLDTLIAFVVIMSVASLLVTIVVQTLSAVFSLRGELLAQGLKQAVSELVPDVKNGLDELTKKMLNSPNAFGRDRLRGSVRPEEVWESLKRMAAVSETQISAKKDAINALSDPAAKAKAEAELKLLEQLPRVSSKSLAPSTEGTAALNLLMALLPAGKGPEGTQAAFGSLLQTVQEAVLTADDRKKFEIALQQASQNLALEVVSLRQAVEDWFNRGVDHAQEWFLGQIRAITIGVGLVMTFVCQWDAVEIYRQISGPNSALRDALVKEVVPVLQKAEGYLPVEGVAASASGGLLETLRKTWNAKTENAQRKIEENTVFKTVPEILAALLARTAEDKKEQTKKDFETFCQAEVGSYFKGQVQAVQSLANMGFEFIPKDGWRWKTGENKSATAISFDYWRHFIGMLIFAALLGLGAPFWFNLLKNLSNLRPALAKLLDSEAQPAPATAK